MMYMVFIMEYGPHTLFNERI